jgi:hypothetical protein
MNEFIADGLASSWFSGFWDVVSCITLAIYVVRTILNSAYLSKCTSLVLSNVIVQQVVRLGRDNRGIQESEVHQIRNTPSNFFFIL